MKGSANALYQFWNRCGKLFFNPKEKFEDITTEYIMAEACKNAPLTEEETKAVEDLLKELHCTKVGRPSSYDRRYDRYI